MRMFQSPEWVNGIYQSIRRVPPGTLGDLFEGVIQVLYSEILKPGDVAVDGGAHLGRHTIPMARLVQAGAIHAFEPIPNVLTKLSHACDRKSLAGSVVAHCAALSNYEGTADFFVSTSDLYFSSLNIKRIPSSWPTRVIRVDVTTIDASVGDQQRLPFVKLDLEGGEYHALLGA